MEGSSSISGWTLSASEMKRLTSDIAELQMNFKVEMIRDLVEFTVDFKGPEDSLYEGGVWKVHVEIQPDFPLKSPSIGFVTRIYHPNIDEESGAICVNVINENWSPMFTLTNIFELFLPDLLRNPNPTDPLNLEAAELMKDNPIAYAEKVKSHSEKFAKAEPEEPTGSDATGSTNEDETASTNEDETEIAAGP